MCGIVIRIAGSCLVLGLCTGWLGSDGFLLGLRRMWGSWRGRVRGGSRSVSGRNRICLLWTLCRGTEVGQYWMSSNQNMNNTISISST